MAAFDFGDVGSILGGAGGFASAVSGIFGGNSAAKKAARLNKKMYKMQKDLAYNGVAIRVADAKRAGIHPLAALGASVGGGGFASPVQDTSYNWGDAVGQGLQAVGNTMSDISGRHAARDADAAAQRASDDAQFQDLMLRMQGEARDARNDDLNAALVKAQIGEITSRTMLMNARAKAIGGAPATTAVVGPKQFQSPAGAWDVGPDTPAQDWSDQYGDMVSEIFGLGNLMADSWRNAKKWGSSKPKGWTPSPSRPWEAFW